VSHEIRNEFDLFFKEPCIVRASKISTSPALKSVVFHTTLFATDTYLNFGFVILLLLCVCVCVCAILSDEEKCGDNE
jgi:hypothetical protein